MAVHIVFVCLGNICRSPSAQGIMEQRILAAKLGDSITVDSCGTAAFNVGKNPDPRAVAACERKGYAIADQIARQINDHDYATADYIIPMDAINLKSVEAWAPEDFNGEMRLFMYYAGAGEHASVPDPYYKDADKFDGTVATLEKAADGLLAHICKAHQL